MVEPGIAAKKTIRLTIGSSLTAVRQVQDQILSEVTGYGFDSHSHFAIRLALEESLINAIKHGNRFDAAKSVHVEYTISTKELDLVVEDEGPGFERHGVPDPTLDENVEKCSGRGILLMEAYMNHVDWSREGRRVHMVKKNESDSGL